ncbi:hypothetical protein Mapa_017536 [Marchantia paleacea]|nr:hypothetical protein Mapa_017536 [Marchantia paleacea]
MRVVLGVFSPFVWITELDFSRTYTQSRILFPIKTYAHNAAINMLIRSTRLLSFTIECPRGLSSWDRYSSASNNGVRARRIRPLSRPSVPSFSYVLL